MYDHLSCSLVFLPFITSFNGLDFIIRDVADDVFMAFYESFASFQGRRTVVEAIVQAERPDTKRVRYDVEIFLGHYKTPFK